MSFNWIPDQESCQNCTAFPKGEPNADKGLKWEKLAVYGFVFHS